MFMLIFLAKIHPACHNDANGFKAGSNSEMTDKNAAECSKSAYFFIQFNVPFKIISLIETSQWVGGAKREYPGKTT